MTVRLTGVIVTLLAITLITIVATVAASAAVAASPPPSTKDAACCHPAPPDLILRQKCYGPRVTNTSQHPTNPADFLVVAESVWRANLSPAPFEYWLNATLHKLSTKSLSEPSNALEEVVKPQEKKKELLPLAQWKEQKLSELNTIAVEGKKAKAPVAPTSREEKVDPRPKPKQKFRRDRYNYASGECGAKTLSANPEARELSAILTGSKDRYMLNPCSAPRKWIVIELCEVVGIQGIQIANHEFFSSMFKDIQILGSPRYPVTHWMSLGNFTAQNLREMQSFELPDDEPVQWVKYIKIRFLNHYGSEFYCPLSEIRVHGLTIVEQISAELELDKNDMKYMDDVFASPNHTTATQPPESHTEPPATSEVSKQPSQTTSATQPIPSAKSISAHNLIAKITDEEFPEQVRGLQRAYQTLSKTKHDNVEDLASKLLSAAMGTPMQPQTKAEPAKVPPKVTEQKVEPVPPKDNGSEAAIVPDGSAPLMAPEGNDENFEQDDSNNEEIDTDRPLIPTKFKLDDDGDDDDEIQVKPAVPEHTLANVLPGSAFVETARILHTLIHRVKSVEMNQSMLTGYVINMTSYYQDEFKDVESSLLRLKNLTDTLSQQLQQTISAAYLTKQEMTKELHKQRQVVSDLNDKIKVSETAILMKMNGLVGIFLGLAIAVSLLLSIVFTVLYHMCITKGQSGQMLSTGPSPPPTRRSGIKQPQKEVHVKEEPKEESHPPDMGTRYLFKGHHQQKGQQNKIHQHQRVSSLSAGWAPTGGQQKQQRPGAAPNIKHGGKFHEVL